MEDDRDMEDGQNVEEGDKVRHRQLIDKLKSEFTSRGLLS